jgi:hypothetical protein
MAANPVFPETAIRQRMECAGISDFPFKPITSYERMHAAKPNAIDPSARGTLSDFTNRFFRIAQATG